MSRKIQSYNSGFNIVTDITLKNLKEINSIIKRKIYYQIFNFKSILYHFTSDITTKTTCICIEK